jgi:hypothetical protein
LDLEPYITEVLPVFRRWKNLRRFALNLDRSDYDKEMGLPEPYLIGQFILGMRHLSYLCIYHSIFSEREFTIFKTKVDDLVQPRRSDFIF